MEAIKYVIGKNGRLAIPAKITKKLGLKSGDEVLVSMAGGEIRIVPRNKSIQQAQEIVRRYIPEGRSLAEELIDNRRQEANDE